jgi:hypothetical protein
MSSSLNGAKQFFLVESHKDGTSCVASKSDGGKGKPSGMVQPEIRQAFSRIWSSGPD